MKRSIMLCTPVRDGVSVDFARMLVDLTRKLPAAGVDFDFVTVERLTHLPAARNVLVGHFLASSATHLLSVDSDMSLPAEAVLKMLGKGKEYVAAGAVLRGTRTLSIPLDVAAPVVDSMMTTHRARVACALIARTAFERVIASGEAKPYHVTFGDGSRHTGRDFFSAAPSDDGELLAEDDAWCARCVRAGVPQHVLLDVNVSHAGTMANAARTLEAARAKGGA